MLLLSSLHIHEQGRQQEESCNECVAHHCGGHLDQQTLHQHDCVLCQFVSLPFLLAAISVLTLFTSIHKAIIGRRTAFCPLVTVDNHSSRAPPYSF